MFNLLPSTATAQAPAVCIGYGTTVINGSIFELLDRGEGIESRIYLEGEILEGDKLLVLINQSAHFVLDWHEKADVEGDLRAPRLDAYDYGTDVLRLAKSKKVQEVEESHEILYGIELEFVHSGHSFKELSPLLSMGVFKEDTSVDCEYVTLPYPYSEMVRKISDLKDSFDKLLSANKELDPNSCVGMHVHISRKGLTDLQLHLLRGLFWKGLGKEAQTSYLCGRLPNGYCQYLPYTGDRNVALNEENKDTVEIRAFLSPSSAEGILRNLRLVKSWLDGEEVTVDIKKVADWWAEHNCCKRFFNQTLVTLDMAEEGFAVARALPYFTGRVSNRGVWVHELRVIRDEIEYGWGRPEPLHPPEPPAQPGWEVFDEPGDFDGDT